MIRILHVVNNNALGGGIGTALDYLSKIPHSEYSTAVLKWIADDCGKNGHEQLGSEDRFEEWIRSSSFLEQTLAQYDILHIHSIPSYRVLEAIGALRREGKCPKIVNTCHSSVKKEVSAHLAKSKGTPDGDEVEKMIKQGMLDHPGEFGDTYWGSAIYRQERIMTLADRVQHMNNAYLEDTITEYRAETNRGKHLVVYNGIDILPDEEVTPRPEQKRILYSGRFAAEKGIDEFVGAIPEVLKQNPGAEVRFMGGDRGGWTMESVKEKAVRTFREKFGPQAETYLRQITFTGWISDKKEINEQYEWCDFLVVPSTDETFCFAIAETLNRRRIPIMTETPSLKELYLSQNAGLGIPTDQRNESGIAYILNFALKHLHKQWMDLIAERGRVLVKERYTLKKMLEQQMELYEDVLATASSPPRR